MPQTTRPRARHHSSPPPHEVAAAPQQHPAPDPRRWVALGVILTASILGVLDFFIVNIAIPPIRSDLQASYAQIQLMLAGYGLTYAVFLVTGGRLGDIYGRKRMFMIGVTGFTVASALCGLAPGPGTLIVARIFQGVAGAVMFPQVLSIIQVSFPPRERSIAFGIFGMVMGIGSFAGNVLGGFLIDANLFGLGWRPVFLVNLPVGIVAFLATAYLVHESRSARAPRLDPGGVVLATLGLFMFIYPLVEGREAGWPLWAFACLAASVPVLALFILYERRVEARGGAPLVELRLFHDRVFVAGLCAALGFYGGLSMFFLAITLFVQNGLQFSPRATGLTFAPFALGFLTASSLGIKWTRALGSRAINLGAALMILGLIGIVWLARSKGTSIRGAELWPLLLLYGTGQGFVMPTLISAILSGIPSSFAGSASGVLTTVQQIALAVGIAIIGTVYFGITGSDPGPDDYARAIGVALLFNIGLLLTTFVLAFRLPRNTHGSAPAHHFDV
jgi:EmrB/QacA subfamily drug resistance transporter